MKIKRGQIPIFIAILVIMVIFLFLALRLDNSEFIIYFGVIVFLFFIILFTLGKTQFSNSILWGLVIWALLHMLGGLVQIDGATIYKIILIPIINTGEFTILRYDQFVHAFGFGISTLIAHHLMKPYLNNKIRWSVYSLLIIFMGMGIGALNEIIEFAAVVVLPKTGVGGYYNTMFDIVFNTIGAIIAVGWINLKRVRNAKK
jgi:uncharacterized membrane protein YjdF